MTKLPQTMQKSLALACLLLAANACSAAEITHKAIRDNFGVILVRGDLTSNDGDAFQQVAYRYPDAGVLLESNGGSLLAGIRIGQIIRERNFSTGVAPDTRCASAGTLTWLGGTTCYMSAKSLIGFHAAYEMQNGVARETGAGNALVGDPAAKQMTYLALKCLHILGTVVTPDLRRHER